RRHPAVDQRRRTASTGPGPEHRTGRRTSRHARRGGEYRRRGDHAMMRALALLLVTLSLLAARDAGAEPYLAVQNGYKCVNCHVNPTGGGLRTQFGDVFSENLLPAHNLPAGFPVWTGKIASFLRMGGDVRASWTKNDVPNNPSQEQHQ